VYLIDYGFAKNMSDISYRENSPLVGTARFMSLNDHFSIGKLFLYRTWEKR